MVTTFKMAAYIYETGCAVCQHSSKSVDRPSYLRSDFVTMTSTRLVVLMFASIVHSDLSDDLTVCFEVLSCFFDHPSIDSTKKMLLHPFGNDVLMNGCY